MNKAAIKKFAVRARSQLLCKVKQRAALYGITEDIASDEQLFSDGENAKLIQLAERIAVNGYTQVMEEAACAWFIRFTALMYMEKNELFPLGKRLFTDEKGAFDPEIPKEAEKTERERLFKYHLISRCNALNESLPYMFEKIPGWLEILMPDNLLIQDSVIGRMAAEIPEEDWVDRVQIIGWLYQYYNSELKDETFALLKKNIKISKERLPSATQLFTPDWIVRYMVENSLGCLWLENNPNDKLRLEWKYYVDNAEQEAAVCRRLEEIREKMPALVPENIKIIDPCAGSGQILTYAFDVLMQIYLSAGRTKKDAVRSILENNLYGLDIDDRAGQLAYFSVMMKACQYDRSILGEKLQTNIIAVKDSSFIDKNFIISAAGKNKRIKSELEKIAEAFAEAKEYGCLIRVKNINHELIYDFAEKITIDDEPDNEYQLKLNELRHILKQAKMLEDKYHIVITNPPYMGAGGMSTKLCRFTKKNYPDSKSDLFAAFIERCAEMTDENGYLSMLTQHTWMFLSSYEKLRAKLLRKTIVNMLHLGAKAFEGISGEVVQTAGFVIRNAQIENYKGTYCRLTEPSSQQAKEEMFLSGKERFVSKCSDFSKIPGSLVAYWVSGNILEKLEKCPKLSDTGVTRLGMTTGENARFVRYWFEVKKEICVFDAVSQEDLDSRSGYWVPYNKGGTFRKWYGNNDYVLYWKDGGKEIKNFADERGRIRSTVPNTEYYFRPCASWSKISTGKISFRYKTGCIFDVAGACYFAQKYDLRYMMGFLNSSVAEVVAASLSPTLNYEGGQIASLPVVYNEDVKDTVYRITEENIEISKSDWDFFETSWDFKRHPLV